MNVDKINNIEFEKLLKLGAEKNIYKNKYSKHVDSKKWSESIKQPKYVELCIGAQVLVTYNIDKDIINGTRGCIISMNANSIDIKLVNNDVVTIPYVKTTSAENDKIYVQFMPLKLAYALSIHRCQGSTLDAIEIDIGKSIFEYGQAYVSLSRAKSLSSIKILDINIKSFKTHPLVKEFYNM
jgi:ATP-dependent DNA helicase PIF1